VLELLRLGAGLGAFLGAAEASGFSAMSGFSEGFGAAGGGGLTNITGGESVPPPSALSDGLREGLGAAGGGGLPKGGDTFAV